jgi:RNA polymerase sigma-70 factor, ECF subfamily
MRPTERITGGQSGRRIETCLHPAGYIHKDAFMSRGSELDTDDLRPLVQSCLAGCPQAMLRLVQRFQGQVFGLCYRMLGRREDAEDAAQETFVRVLRSLSRWDSSRDFEPWLLAIAGNRCRTALAARKRRPPMENLDDLSPASPGRLDQANHLAEEVQRALERVRPEYRQAFVLFHEHEKSYGEIAEMMEVPLGTVKTWVHRARRELIDQLRQRGAVEDMRYAVRRI